MKSLTIATNTFLESIRQPFYVLVVVLVLAAVGILTCLPFFTFGKDHLMFVDVCLAFILAGLLVMSLLLASKVVDEEIEARTTLTLMSKPVRRGELIVGKFAGVMMAATLALVLFGAALLICTWLRLPNDLGIRNVDTIIEEQAQQLADARYRHLMSLLPALVLVWLQIAVLSAIAVALSTRIGMVANMVVGVGLFIVAHLLPMMAVGAGRPAWQQKLAGGLMAVLPNLETFNLNSLLIYKNVVFAATAGRGEITYRHLWELTGMAGGYAVSYVAAALLLGLALFRTRELG